MLRIDNTLKVKKILLCDKIYDQSSKRATLRSMYIIGWYCSYLRFGIVVWGVSADLCRVLVTQKNLTSPVPIFSNKKCIDRFCTHILLLRYSARGWPRWRDLHFADGFLLRWRKQLFVPHYGTVFQQMRKVHGRVI